MRVALAGAFPPQRKGEANYLGTYERYLREAADAELDVRVVAQDVTYADRSKGPLRFGKLHDFVAAVEAVAPDIVHVHYGPGRDYGGRIGEPLADALGELRRSGIRTCLTLHSLWLPEHVRDAARGTKLPEALDPLAVWYFRRHMRRLRAVTDRFYCLVSGPGSPMTDAFGREYGLTLLEEEVHGCEPRATPLPGGTPIVFAFGFIRPDKGLHVLVDAFERYRAAGGEAILRIAGQAHNPWDRAYADDIARRMAALGPAAEMISTYVDDARLEELLHESTVVVVPYLRNIGASGPLHHALGVGRPIIATNLGHNAALSGAIPLVAPGDAAGLAAELRRVLEDEATLRGEAERVRAIAERRSWTELAHERLFEYRRLVA